MELFFILAKAALVALAVDIGAVLAVLAVLALYPRRGTLRVLELGGKYIELNGRSGKLAGPVPRGV